MLQHAGKFAVFIRISLRDDLKGVQRVAVFGGVNPRVLNAEGALVKVATNAGKQIGLIRRVHQHLQPLTCRRAARTHNGFGAAHMARKLFGVPGNVNCLVAHEVADVQRVPQRLVGCKRQGVQSDQNERLAFAQLHLGIRIRRSATQYAQRVAVQIFKQLGFPGVPHLGAGAANVGHCEQIKRGEISLAAHALGKGGDHVRVAQVGFLRDTAHGEMLLHQKFD